MFKKLLDSLEILVLFFFFPWSSLLKETLRKQLHLKGKGVPDTREKGNCVLLNDFFFLLLLWDPKKSDYGYQITLRQKKKKSLDQSSMRKEKEKKKFTQVLFYAHNSICFSNTSICS